jgi:hypothetical protein
MCIVVVSSHFLKPYDVSCNASSFTLGDQILHLFTASGTIIVLDILIFTHCFGKQRTGAEQQCSFPEFIHLI